MKDIEEKEMNFFDHSFKQCDEISLEKIKQDALVRTK
jgi:hypothetical protein